MTTIKPSKSGSIIDNIFDPFLFNFEIPRLKNGKLAPRLRDIYILTSSYTKQHYVRFYVLGMERMFKTRNLIIKVEYFGTISIMLSWNLNDESKWIKQKLEKH
jgi:hypothetical protein